MELGEKNVLTLNSIKTLSCRFQAHLVSLRFVVIKLRTNCQTLCDRNMSTCNHDKNPMSLYVTHYVFVNILLKQKAATYWGGIYGGIYVRKSTALIISSKFLLIKRCATQLNNQQVHNLYFLAD